MHSSPEANGVIYDDGRAHQGWAPGRPGLQNCICLKGGLLWREQTTYSLITLHFWTGQPSINCVLTCVTIALHTQGEQRLTLRRDSRGPKGSQAGPVSWVTIQPVPLSFCRQVAWPTLKSQKVGEGAAHLSGGESHSDWPAGTLSLCSPSPSLPSVSAAPGLS